MSKEVTEDRLVESQRTLEYHRSQHEIARLQSETAALESIARWNSLASQVVGVHESLYDGFNPRYVDPSTPFYDSPGFSPGGEPFDRPADLEDTRDGRFRPYWVSLPEFLRLQGTLRHVATGHEIGRNIMDTLCDYVVHTGFGYTVEAASLEDKSEFTESLAKSAQTVIDEFHRENDFLCCRESSLISSLLGYGESLSWIRHAGGGKSSIVEVPNWQIVEPKQQFTAQLEDLARLPASSWSYGVVTDLEDTSQVRAFFWDRDHVGTNYDVIPADEAVWVKWNTPDPVKRGLSEFYPLLGVLALLPPVLRNIVVQTGIQASIAYIRKSSTGVAPQTQGVMPLGTTGTATVMGPNGSSRNIASQIHRPGEIHDTAGVDYHAGPMGDSQAREFLGVYEGALRTVGQRWSMPEYLISGVADTSNRATAETSMVPFVRRVERMQGLISPPLHRLHSRVLDIAARAGRFSDWGVRTVEDLYRTVSLNVSPPPPKNKDASKDIVVDTALVDARAMSKQTLSERYKLDWEQEHLRMEEEQDDEVINPGPLNLGDDDSGGFGQGDAKDEGNQSEGNPKKSGSEVRESSDCGANAPGGGGFRQDNTCAAGNSPKDSLDLPRGAKEIDRIGMETEFGVYGVDFNVPGNGDLIGWKQQNGMPLSGDEQDLLDKSATARQQAIHKRASNDKNGRNAPVFGLDYNIPDKDREMIYAQYKTAAPIWAKVSRGEPITPEESEKVLSYVSALRQDFSGDPGEDPGALGGLQAVLKAVTQPEIGNGEERQQERLREAARLLWEGYPISPGTER